MVAQQERSVPARQDVPREQTWAIERVFATTKEWEAALSAAEARLPEFEPYRGRLGESAATLLAALQVRDEVVQAVDLVATVALMRRSEDATATNLQAMADRGVGLYTRANAAAAFYEPEIAAIPDQTLTEWLQSESGLEQFRHAIERIQDRKAHIRSAEVEETLARAFEVTSSLDTIRDILEDGELPLGTIRDESGAEVKLEQGNLDHYLDSDDRRVRQEAWERSADAYLAFQGTFGATLAGAVKRDVFNAQVRGYPSALAAALAPDGIPTEVFHTLLDTVWKNFPVWQRYFDVRRRLLGLAEGDFHGWDIEAPVASQPLFSFDQGVALIAESLAPMGPVYVEAVQQGIADRWIDRAANIGKGGGAFSWGTYGMAPLISMTYQDNLRSVSTLTHELGHSMHSALAWQSQPYTYAEYGMTIAETASNFHQAMMGAHLLKQENERDLTIAIIEERMANHLRYLFTMPILARFELDSHERIERGEALTAEGMNETLLSFYQEGYGDSMVLSGDDGARVSVTWARFSHLFSNFYVFQYALGISAAAAMANAVQAEGEAAAERFLDALRAGGSRYQLDTLREAGVDLRSPEPVQRAFDVLSGYVDRLETFVD